MNIYYFETSAWLKRHGREKGSAWLMEWLDIEPREFACSQLGLIEVLAVLARRRRAEGFGWADYQELHDEVSREFGDMTTIPIDESIFELSRKLAGTYSLKGAGTVHLASAFSLRDALGPGENVVMLAADREVLDAAYHAGFAVLDPEAEEN